MDSEHDAPLEDAANLRQEPVAPARLESKVVDALRNEGLVRSTSRVTSFSWPSRIAASLLIFVAGAVAGQYARPDRTAASPGVHTQPRYMLLLAGDVAPAADGSTRAEEYGNWAQSLGARGVEISGDELTEHAELVSDRTGAAFSDLASVGGYFLIEASDDAAAAALARTCPHVKYGGSIVVRRLR